MNRDRCGSCGSNILQPFLDLGTTPLADAFPKSPDEWETFYPLGLVVCQRCWLVQNSYVVPDDLLYNADYGFYTGSSPSAVAYFEEYAKWAIEHFAPQFVVEIASNDGTLLRHFADAGATVMGVEPSANVAAAANARDLLTAVAPFGRQAAYDVALQIGGKADLIIANNVVAHVSDLDDFLGGIELLLAPLGRAVVEFQNLPDLLLGNQFDHVYHEHRSFFSLDSFARAIRPYGFHIIDYRHTPAQGGSIRVTIGRDQPLDWWKPADTWLQSPDAYTGFQGRIDHLRDRLRDLIYSQSGTVAGYGATAKSTTLLNYCGLGPDDLAYVEDLTPTKIGRFTPGTHIPIVEPDPIKTAYAPPTYLLLAWNYLPSILRRERAFMDAGGKFIVPIPMPTLI